MESIWDATCECGQETRVEIQGKAGGRRVRVGCDEHWFELPVEGLKDALEKVASSATGSPETHSR